MTSSIIREGARPEAQGRVFMITDFRPFKDTSVESILDMLLEEDVTECSRLVKEYDYAKTEIGLKSKAMVYQVERAPQTGKVHVQLAVRFKNAIRKRTVIQLVKPCHVELCMGSAHQIYKYHTKDESRVCGPYFHPDDPDDFHTLWFGEQGRRSDLAIVAEKVLNGDHPSVIARAHPSTFLRMSKQILAYSQFISRPRMWDPVACLYLTGPTGSGKSKWAHLELKRIIDDAGGEFEDVVYSKVPGKWFDNYFGQQIVLIDEYDAAMSYELLLKVTDRYMAWAEIKGSTVRRQWHAVIITSKRSPSEWYPDVGDVGEFNRRVTTKFTFPEPLGVNYDMKAALLSGAPQLDFTVNYAASVVVADTVGVAAPPEEEGEACAELSDSPDEVMADVDHYAERLKNNSPNEFVEPDDVEIYDDWQESGDHTPRPFSAFLDLECN